MIDNETPRERIVRSLKEDIEARERQLKKVERLPIEVLKERFPEGWGYVSFMRDGSKLAATAEPFRKSQCYDCHLEHGATDNVFTQFYPLLRR